MKPVRCPKCELAWNIPDDAPPVITCPRCLAALTNPYPSTDPRFATGSKPPPMPGTGPMRVIPVESQAQTDYRVSNVGLFVVIAVILVGIVAFFAAVGMRAGVSVQAIVGLVVIAAAALVPILLIARKKHATVPALSSQSFESNVQPGGVLNYSAPMRDPRKLSGGAFFAQCIGGIILGIVGGAFLTGALASIADGSFAIFALGAPVVAGAVLCTRPRVRGLGVGLILALPAAFLLLLGFCAILIGGSGMNFH